MSPDRQSPVAASEPDKIAVEPSGRDYADMPGAVGGSPNESEAVDGSQASGGSLATPPAQMPQIYRSFIVKAAVDGSQASGRSLAAPRARMQGTHRPFIVKAAAGSPELRRVESVCRRITDVPVKKAEWLWPPWVPVGELTMIDGDPGTSKSLWTADLAARISRGGQMPGGATASRGGVLLLVGEDTIATTVRPRLEAAGADTDCIIFIGEPEEPIVIPDDLKKIEEPIVRMRAECAVDLKLIVIDPIMNFLGPNASGDQSVRRALAPLKALAERHGVAVVLVRHLNKSGRGSALYRGSGSIGISAAARSCLLVTKCPDDPNLRVVYQYKNNLGRSATSLLFEPVSTEDGGVRLEYRGERDYSEDELLAKPKRDAAVARAASFLSRVLADGPVTYKDVQNRAREEQIALRTLERAKSELGVVSSRSGFGPASIVSWGLPK
jgi:hypothetical protein